MPRHIVSVALASMLLLPLAHAPVTAQAQTGEETLVGFESTGWRYKVVDNGQLQGFQAKAFDDSGFSTGAAAFGSGGGCPLQQTVKTNWPINKDLLVRRAIELPAGATGVKIFGGVDNSLDVYWNGTQVGDRYNQEFCTTLSSFSYSVPDELVTPGTNILAVRAGDHGAESFLDLSVTGTRATPCESSLTEGYFQPTQGVWQDDAVIGSGDPSVAAFDDRAGKQLEKLAPLDDEIRYEAQLDMVRNKDTLLFGIDHAVPSPEPNDRFNIVANVTTNCTRTLRTRFRFTLQQGPSMKTIGTSPHLGEYKLTGPAGETSTYPIKMYVPTGFPKDPFRFSSSGSYLLRAEVFTPDQGPMGLRIDVGGNVVSTTASRVGFVPIVLNDRSRTALETLKRRTVRMALESYRHVPDMFPLPHRQFPVGVEPIQNLSTFTEKAVAEWVAWLRQLTDFSTANLMSEARLAAVDARFASIAQMSPGTGRVVAVFSNRDFESLLPASLRGRVGGFTSSTKFIGLPSDAPWQTVAHEYAHSVPSFLWSKDQMSEECGVDYHNTMVDLPNGTRAPLKIAHGYQITDGPDGAARILKDPQVSIMGPTGNWTHWMDQCTYWHLLKVLQEPIDPPTLLVAGRLGRSPTAEIGELFPMYQLDGIVDLGAGTGGSYAFITKDASGTELDRYPFEPQWSLDDGTDRNAISFSYRLPDIEGVASLELVGPHGVLDTRVFSASAPTVAISRPRDGAKATVRDGKVVVTWKGTDADGDELLYTVTYSSDGGKTWRVLSLERPSTRIRFTVGKHTAHTVRVTATDGARSASDEVKFSTPRR